MLQFVNYRFCYIFVKSIGIQIVVVPLWRLVLKLVNKIEYMCKKSSIVLLFVAVSSFVVSCIDKNYDLANKEIATDVKIEGNSIAVPVGSLKSVVLDSLIDVSGIEMLEKGADGVYSITMDSTISVEESIEPITLNIDPIQHRVDIEFDEVNVNNVHIDAVNIEPAKFTTPSISLQDLNDKLPMLESEAHVAFDVPGLVELLENLKNYYPDGTLDYTISEQQVTTGEREVACNFSYELPKEIETINSIKLGSEADAKGTLVSVAIANPKILDNCNKEISFKVEFPEIFALAINENAEQYGKYRIDGSTIYLDGYVPQGDRTFLSFYITEIAGIDRYIKDGSINVNETVKYKVDYEAGGNVILTKDVEIADFAFDVEFESQLSFQDVAGKTKDIKVDFKAIEMAFSGDFDNLEYIDTIKYVEFDETVSRIKFETHMEKDWLNVFKLKEGYALKISFPHQLDICPDHSEYEGKDKEIVYDSEEHAFYIYDLGILAETHWNLALQKLTLDIPVTKDPVSGKGKCHMDVKADIRFVNTENPEETGCFYLAAIEMESLVDILEKLEGEKEAQFTMSESDLVIKDAVVHTEVIHSSLNSGTDFSLNEKIPAEIERIEKIGFSKDVEIALELSVIGLENLDTDINLDVKVALPTFLKLQLCGGTTGVDVSEGLLGINTAYNPSSAEPLEIKLLCTGLDFMTEEFGFNGIVPKDSTDGNSYISYSCDIAVEGDATINGTEFHSTVLENDIAFDVNFKIEEIAVKTFHGIYSAQIEKIEEKLDLDLGEELEFLREDGNSVTLADPQLEFVLSNPVGIPVDIALHLFGNDENGAIIPESEISTTLSILPAEYNETTEELTPVETKLFIATDTAKNKKSGFTNVQIPNLANLLKKIPYSVNIDVEPVVRTADVTHHVDIEQPIKLDGAYSVVVPLKFNDLHLCYNDTITDLDSSLGETVKMFSNVSVGVKMDIVNTIPLALSLKVVPLDADGNVIDDIEIDELKIAAGNGETLLDANGALNANLPVQAFSFAIKSKSGDISSLDGLAFSLEAASDHTTGSAAINGEQGIKISNIVFEVSGDIEADLKDLGL